MKYFYSSRSLGKLLRQKIFACSFTFTVFFHSSTYAQPHTLKRNISFENVRPRNKKWSRFATPFLRDERAKPLCGWNMRREIFLGYTQGPSNIGRMYIRVHRCEIFGVNFHVGKTAKKKKHTPLALTRKRILWFNLKTRILSRKIF